MIASAPGIGEFGTREDELARMVAAARRTIPFYRDRLAGVRFSSLTDLPTCTKADLRSYGSFPLTAGPPNLAYRIAATSGTTGPRLFVAYSRSDWDRIGRQLGERAAAIGFGRGDMLLNTHGYGLWIGGATLDLLASVSGAALLPAGPTNTAQVMEWLAGLPITALSATPSYMRYLVETAQKQGVDPRGWGLKTGFIGGEGASLTLRRQICAALGTNFRWQELYGSTETGGPVLGFARPDAPLGGDLLLDTREFIVELLHPDRDQPVEPGELGELTVTTPFRELSPLIRYRTRDLAAEVVDGPPASVRPPVGSPRSRAASTMRSKSAAPLSTPAPSRRWWPPSAQQMPNGASALAARVEAWTCSISKPSSMSLPLPMISTRLLFDRIAIRPQVEPVPPGSLERFRGKASRVRDDRPKDA